MQEINLYIAELMIIFAFIYNNLEKEGIVMKRMMKSKILATALCSTVMAGIYASPVMAEKLYYGQVGGSVYVSGEVILREEIKDLELDGKLTVGAIEVDKLNGVELGDLVDKSALEQEKNDRIAGDTALEEKINGESLIRQEKDTALEGKINAESLIRQEKDKALEEKINGESQIRQDADKELADKISQEEMKRKNEDAAIRGEIGQEVADRAQADQKLADKIGQEEADRKAADDAIRGEIGQEVADRAQADQKLADKIGQEEADRKAEVARLDGEVNRLDGRINNLEDRIDKVGAMSAAIANLRTMGYDPAAPTEIAVGIGQYRNETGMALGMFHYPNRDFMLSLSVSTSGDEVMGGIGATWKFGRKTPEQMLAAEKEKAAKAKLAKAEAMKKAAVEAKVAAQQAKHAKMAAEKAAK